MLQFQNITLFNIKRRPFYRISSDNYKIAFNNCVSIKIYSSNEIKIPGISEVVIKYILC